MDAYPKAYIDHNLPLIVLSGLRADSSTDDSSRNPVLASNGYKLAIDLPVLTGATAETLQKLFLQADVQAGPWNNRSEGGRAGAVGFKVTSVGRVGQAPSARMHSR